MTPSFQFSYGGLTNVNTSPAITFVFDDPSGSLTLNNLQNNLNRLESVSFPSLGLSASGISETWSATVTTYSLVQVAHTITASAGANGSISPSGAVTVNDGDNQSFTISPNANYHVADVLVDNVSQGAITTYTFNNVTADHTISATFAINTHTITASAGSNGSISPSGTITGVVHNTTQSFTVAPSGGYQTVMSGTCGGNLVGGTYITNPITADCTVNATFNSAGSSQLLPPDSNVQVPVHVGSSTTVNVTFSQITSGGTLSITNNNPGGGPPTGFKFLGTYYDVSFTGSFSGYIYITIPYNGSSVPSGKEPNLRLFHWKNNGWEDCTYSLDTVNNTITGRVTSLSPFGIGYDSSSGGSGSGPSTGANENMIALIAILAISLGVFILRKNKWLRKA